MRSSDCLEYFKHVGLDSLRLRFLLNSLDESLDHLNAISSKHSSHDSLHGGE